MMAYYVLVYSILCIFTLKRVELKECKEKSLGLRKNDGLPYYYFQGTSYRPEIVKKHINKDLASNGATWCPEQSRANGSFLEVDLGKQYLLCGVSTQGDTDTNSFTADYKIKLSSNRIHWKFFKNGTILTGNNDSTAIVYHSLNSTDRTRFVRFYPVGYNMNACIRVELYGDEVKKEKCDMSLLEVNSPSVVTSFPNTTRNKILAALNGTEQWCWPSNYMQPYIKVNFATYSVICALQVNFSGTLEVLYGNESVEIKSMNIHGSQLYTPKEKILTTLLHFKPTGNSTCLAVKIFGYLNKELTNEDIGFQYGKYSAFSDASLATSSEQFDKNLANPRDGRLYKPWKFWCPFHDFLSSYLEFILVKKYYIFAVSVQGQLLQSGEDFAKEFTLSYSEDYRNWEDYHSKYKVTFNNVIEKHFLAKPIEARIMKVKLPKAGLIGRKTCVKVEVHGIEAKEKSEYCTNPHPLGLTSQLNTISDDRIEVSSEPYTSYPRKYARLSEDVHNCWCSSRNKPRTISVNFGQLVGIFGVATQGCTPGKVTKYKIRYGYDGRTWYGYPHNTGITVLLGNSPSSDGNTIFANWLNDSVTAGHVQIELEDFDGNSCLRLEVYGCQEGVKMPTIEQKSDSRSLSRNINSTVTLECRIRGQAGINVSWNRDENRLQESSFEKIKTDYPKELVISAVTKTQINVSYNNDRDIYSNFYCQRSKNNSRRLLCKSVYSCSAGYPNATTQSQGNISVTITPDIVLPGAPGNPIIRNIKSRSAVITWKAADDYVESILTRYIVQVSNVNNTVIFSVTSGIELKNLSYHLQNLTEYTFYNVSIAAESAIKNSTFTEKVAILTLYGARLTVQDPGVKVVNENDTNIIISCKGKSYPTPIVVWKRNGSIIDLAENSSVPSNDKVYQIQTSPGRDNKLNVPVVISTLYLRPNGIRHEDHGNYTCEVLNLNESNVPRRETVEIQFPPRIIEHPPDGTIKEGENITLACDADGPPKPYLTWSVNSKNVTIQNTIRSHNMLELQNVRSAGLYKFTVTCKAANKGGSRTANATIEILVNPRIIYLSPSQTGLLYSNVALRCEILANPPAQIWWTKDDNKTLPGNVRLENQNKTLVVTKAVLADIGKYSCHARYNVSSTKQSLTLSLKARPKAFIVGEKTKKMRNGQQNASIHCLGYGYPNPNATWKINDTEIPEDQNSSIDGGIYQRRSTNDSALDNVTSTLYFNQSGTTFEDYGNYTCEVTIENAHDIDSKIVEILFYPIVLSAQRNKTVLEGKNVRFDCKVDGRPHPKTLWLWKNQTINQPGARQLSNGSLLLPSVENNELYEGRYSCFAENAAGKSGRSVRYLTVHVPAKILNISKTEVYKLNDNVALTCNVMGDPTPSISWTRTNYSNPLVPPKYQLSNYNRSLTIMNATLKERGTYICEAKNEYAKDTRNVTVNLEVRPEVEVNTSSAIYLNSTDQQAIIRCRGRGYPPPVVSWFSNGDEIDTNTSSDVHQVNHNGATDFLEWIATILYVKPDSSLSQFRNYTCNGTNLENSKKDLENIEIVLVPKVSITKTPNTSTVLEGTNINFTCIADGAPKPTISWSRVLGNNSVAKSSIKTPDGRNILMLTNVTNSEEGMYICTAQNRGKPVKRKVDLIVHVKPRILKQLKNDDVQNGTSYKLNCTADGDPALQYSWNLKGRRHVPNGVLLNGSKTLHINPVTIDNEGIYTCMVTNIEGNASTTANITVFALPIIRISPMNQTKNETDSGEFTCGGDGIPAPKVIWQNVDGNETQNTADYVIKHIEKPYNFRMSYLTINNLEYADRGKYSCKLMNIKGEDVTSAVLVVQVRPRATIFTNIPNVKITRPVNLTCTAYGFPKPVVSWMRNGQKIENDNHYDISLNGNQLNLTWYSNLGIENARRNDTANYTCFLRNAAGTDEDNVSLVVLERPDPLDVKIRNVTPRSVVVVWKVVFDGNTDILYYNLTYFINGSHPTGTISKRVNTASYHVTLLKPYTKYIFEVTATNEIGDSDVARGSVNTLEDKPTSPQHVKVFMIDTTSLNVTWQPPQEENGKILYYVIYYQRVESSKEFLIVATATERQKVIINLKPYTNYSIHVAANTSAGYGNKSDETFERTDQAAPSTPRNLTLIVESNTTILVTWLPPENKNGIISEYNIQVMEGINSFWWNINVTGKASSKMVNHLKPYTNYAFRTRARTIRDWGNFSETKTKRTFEGLPSEPLNVTANLTQPYNTTVNVSWSAPRYRNGIITRYHIYYQNMTENKVEHQWIDWNNMSETSHVVTALTPYTNYSFWVRAETSAGVGNKSVPTTTMTDEGVPSEPRNVSAEALNSTSLNVSWLEPANPRGIILSYIVYYQKEGNDNGNKKIKVIENHEKLLTALKVSTQYHVFVQAFTKAGGGKRSEVAKGGKTKSGVPVPPTDIPGTPPTTEPGFDPTTMIAITLPKFSDENGDIIFYRIIVVMIDNTVSDERLKEYFDGEVLLSHDDWWKEEDKIGIPYIAFAFKGESFEENKVLTVGSRKKFDNTLARRKKRSTNGQLTNGDLIPNKEYAVAVRGYTEKNKFSTSKYGKFKTEDAETGEQGSSLDIAVVIVIIVVAVILSALFLTAIWLRLKKNGNGNGETGSVSGIGIRNLSHPVPREEFRFYVQSTRFEKEFQGMEKCVNRETNSAVTTVNMQKNRYRNIIPYDYTRVRLHRNEGDEDTDYINASFIKGLKIPSKYIATQGPTPQTANDFWQMVWEQDVSVIVMLTGLEEKGTVKCYQYWPANGEEKQYGSLKLKLTGETVLADFTRRYFKLKDADTKQVRLIEHLHFTAWPDHGVPVYPGPLLHFHKCYRSGLTGPEPVVVHCSAGVGRTGTFIALDYILHKLDDESNNDPSIDILHFVREMRGQRMFMVQTEAQYKFIHHAILEAILFPDTETSSADVRVKAAKLKEKLPGATKTKGKEVFENLQQRILVESCEDATSGENQKKNRSDLHPFDYNRVELEQMENCTNYINASFICGYQYPRNFIATQHPLPHTVNDFWRMVHEQKSAVIVALVTKDELGEFGSYWPEAGFTSYGPINVAFEGSNDDFATSGFVVRKFKLTDTREKEGRSFAVTHYHFVDWADRNLPAQSSMLCLLAEVEKAQRSSGGTLVTVHCSDGGGRTGTFCALVSCIERVKVETNIDMPMTMRNLQAQRMNMIANEAQYIYCYDVISAFLESFDEQMYDNFKNVDKEPKNYPETTTDGQNRLVSQF